MPPSLCVVVGVELLSPVWPWVHSIILSLLPRFSCSGIFPTSFILRDCGCLDISCCLVCVEFVCHLVLKTISIIPNVLCSLFPKIYYKLLRDWDNYIYLFIHPGMCSIMSNSLWPHGLYPTKLLVCGIFQARILEHTAISSSRGSFLPRGGTHVSYVFCICRRIISPLCHPRKPHG